MSQLVNNGDSVIDIGANIGTTAISLSRSVGESGKVFVFEPQQIISQYLSTNVLLII
jgi:FkbM family methyltransferase